MQPAPRSEEIQPLLALFKDADLARLEPLAADFAARYPGHGLGWMLLAAIHKAADRQQEALAAQLRAIEVMPPKAELYSNLGNIQFALDQLAQAEQSYRKCLQLDPQYARGHYNYGLLLLAAGRPQEAERHLRHALRQDPKSAEIRYQTALSLLDQQQYSQGLALLKEALALRPDYPAARDSLSFAHLNLGQLELAVAAGRAAVESAPGDAAILGNLVFTLNYGNATPAETMAMAQRYGQLVSGRSSAQRMTFAAPTAAPAKLRIGFVSGDFKNHPVAYFLLGLLAAIDRTQFECFAYSTIAFEDESTRKIQAQVHAWKVLPAADLQAARQIQADGIHILIDLAGHTGHGRLPLFSLKPAPVQVSWLGYFSTTGLPEMDYVLADEIGAPAAESGQFTEAVWYLPETRLCFTPPEMALEVKPLPALKNRFVTFGCYQNIAKVNDAVLECWKQVFGALPKARLRWQALQFADMEARRLMFARLRRYGLPETRVQLLKGETRPQYLASYRHVDMILDTFPFPGGTTTCEALWMGVPTLTFAGSSLLSRQGASLLTAAGLRDWVACDAGQFQRKAVAFATDIAALAQLRGRLRTMVEASPLFDNARFARNFEHAMRGMWEQSLTRNFPRGDAQGTRHEHTD